MLHVHSPLPPPPLDARRPTPSTRSSRRDPPTRSKPRPPVVLTTPPNNPLPTTHAPSHSSRRAVPAEFFTRRPVTNSASTGVPLSAPRVIPIDTPPSPRPTAPAVSRPAGANIPHLREALSSLESKMALLMNEREQLESCLEQAVRLQAPIQRLPSELLASIFAIGVVDTQEDESLMLSSLMLVCRYWSNVVVTTPVLWSKIVVSNHHSLDRASRRLSRSKSVPLDVSIHFDPKMEDGRSTMEAIVLAMDVLEPSIWRWKSFRLSVPSRPQAHAALARCREKAPMLEDLQIHIFHSMHDEHYSPPPFPLFAGYMPRLTACSLNSFNFDWSAGLVSGLRALELGGYWNGFAPSVLVILGLLRACPALEELTLRNMSDTEAESCATFEHEPHHNSRFPSHIIHLPRLTKASFYYAGIHRTRSILSQITFPALEKVELCYMDNITQVINHLKRQSLTSLPLQHLRIEACFFNELEFAKLLGRVPTLRTLELVDVEEASSLILRTMSTPVTQSWICPKLENLTLDGCTTLEWDALRIFIESRLSAHARAYPRLANVPEVTLPPPTVFSASSSVVPVRPRAHPHPSPAAVRAPVHGHGRSQSAPPDTCLPWAWPQRLKSLDITRCHQISKEMVQWLRIYVPEVKFDVPKGSWREASS
ncbi:hypothetical protein OF83DRAFT_1049419 [Amylostereum chailletii]|nr:hypothetical protein OF83DRAFT_1049419 [Amylostereum chailletii]